MEHLAAKEPESGDGGDQNRAKRKVDIGLARWPETTLKRGAGIKCPQLLYVSIHDSILSSDMYARFIVIISWFEFLFLFLTSLSQMHEHDFCSHHSVTRFRSP